ncbi:sporulation protein YtxC [Virgibacillus halodenitrificans]|uniref:sporulation protein YtxC n=1 Tax=Virgibacillus halodenitrificans TaxID=1482 RepID=UPI00045CA778|nr:sporulation protein YtxC [Virgibacillus halodenitrificans]CDQ36951.1 putative sporulation protein YtxC [Virgibacillus halodenitrificans]
MLEVYLESDKEVSYFCDRLFYYDPHIELCWKRNEDWGNHLCVDKNAPADDLTITNARAMVDVFIKYRLRSCLKEIIYNYYYYTNADEVERILDLAQWIVRGDDEDSRKVRNDKDPSNLLMSLFIANFKNIATIHFDSIVKFGLKSFKEKLVYYVGLAIDEFKREEEHQEFVNMLREYIIKKDPIITEIHVLQGDSFTFYHSDGKIMSPIELHSIMQKEPLYMVGLDEEEMNLAPLIAMAPAKVNIYGDMPDDPKTLTVINVFQERASLFPYRNFPFLYKIKKQ